MSQGKKIDIERVKLDLCVPYPREDWAARVFPRALKAIAMLQIENARLRALLGEAATVLEGDILDKIDAFPAASPDVAARVRHLRALRAVKPESTQEVK